MTTQTFMKDPDAVKDYRWDWATWLEDGDTIATYEVFVPANTLTLDSDSNDATSVTVWLSGGVADSDVRVTVRVTTAQGRTDDLSALFKVREQ